MSAVSEKPHTPHEPHSAQGKFFTAPLSQADPEIAGVLDSELLRQHDEIELIASENYVSRAVLEAAGSVLTNKYAEGYPGKRYYGGCHVVDVAEELAIKRAKELFNCEFANVQPHSGSQANQGVFLALLKPGETILGMGIDMGGHLTHGAAPNMSGKWFNALHYGVRRDTGYIDYEQVEQLAKEHKPRLIIAGGSAYAARHRFQALPRDCRQRWRAASRRHGAFRGACCGRRSSKPLPACAYRHHHHT